MFERYTEAARRALFFARDEVTQRGGRSIETEHLLLGLIRSPTPVVDRLLAEAEVSSDAVRVAVELRLIETEKIPTSVEIPFSLPAKRVLQFTAEEADRLQHHHIGTEHLLLALIRDPETLAGSVLAELGLRLEPARTRIGELMNDPEHVHSGATLAEAVTHIARLQELVEEFAHDAVNRGASSDDAQAILDEFEALKQRFGG